jgi:aspartyl-tRNA(Asn)/glutamyl-tRNA(Gln) amidotransferase subunit A
MDLFELSIRNVSRLIAEKSISPVELTIQLLDRISNIDAEIHAYLHVNEHALEYAKESEKRIMSGDPLRPLEGIPIAIKDNICTIDQPTTCASKILEGYQSPYDATVVSKLRKAGAVLIGKTNMDEFAFGSSTENSAFGPTHNPHDKSRVPGGSSGGSAASVAACTAFGALGSDTGGSIRQPAAFCGVVGLKPTYGRVSRYGLVAFGSSLDQIGPLCRNVEDAAMLLGVIAGYDEHDATSSMLPVPDYVKFLKNPSAPEDIKIGVADEYLGEGIESQVRKTFESVIAAIEQQGFTVRKIPLPHTKYGIATYYILATAEASTNLARFDGVKFGRRSTKYSNVLEMYLKSRGEGFGPEVKRRIILGTFVLSSGYYEAYYLKAQKVRAKIRKDFEDAFQKVDLILAPTTPEIPFLLGEKMQDPLRMYLSDIFTVNANLAGIPSINLPICDSFDKLPVGIQIMGPWFQEEKIFVFAHYLENLFTKE